MNSKILMGVATAALLSGCSVTPKPLAPSELAMRAQQNAVDVTANQEPVGSEISLYDAMGRLALRKQVEYRTESVELDVSDLPNGIYMVNLNGIGKMKSEKLLIEK